MYAKKCDMNAKQPSEPHGNHNHMQLRGRNSVRIYFSGNASTCPVYSTLLLRPFSFTISV